MCHVEEELEVQYEYYLVVLGNTEQPDWESGRPIKIKIK
jgi:hypothetical protein